MLEAPLAYSTGASYPKETMSSSETIIGFDARSTESHLAREWDDARRSRYLLRLDVALPFSADPLVWPSPWTVVTPSGLIAAAGGPSGMERGPETLEVRLAQSPPRGEYAAIAVSILDSTLTTGRFVESLRFLAATTRQVSLCRDLALLGYDVGDDSLISGLMNCGFPDSDAGTLRTEWASSLNRYHLFYGSNTALKFRDIMNKRVPEHAPFYVFGVYRLTFAESRMGRADPDEQPAQLAAKRQVTHSDCYMRCMERRAELERQALEAFQGCRATPTDDRSRRSACAKQFRETLSSLNKSYRDCTDACG